MTKSFHILKLHHLYFRTIHLWLGQRSIKKKNDTQFTFSRDSLIFEKLPTKVWIKTIQLLFCKKWVQTLWKGNFYQVPEAWNFTMRGWPWIQRRSPSSLAKSFMHMWRKVPLTTIVLYISWMNYIHFQKKV